MFIIVLGIRPPGLTLAQYVAHMTCGLLLFLTTSQALMSATSALSQEPGLLFNVVFPAELFPVREVLIACPALFAALSVPASVWGFSSGTVGWSWLLLPPLTVLFLMALIGSAWILALANLVVRDTSQILAFGLTLLMLTSPIAFVKEMLPQQARLLVQLNPFASYVLSFQEIIVHGRAPGAALSISVVTISVIIFHLGYALFKRGKSVIAENI
jgi:lipopolysaccharide transport system permease protein